MNCLLCFELCHLTRKRHLIYSIFNKSLKLNASMSLIFHSTHCDKSNIYIYSYSMFTQTIDIGIVTAISQCKNRLGERTVTNIFILKIIILIFNLLKIDIHCLHFFSVVFLASNQHPYLNVCVKRII